MNIFVLDRNPIIAAQYHCDRHVVKMILESAQMLSTATGMGYKPTHHNHPCTLWVKQSAQNALWLHQLAFYLNREWQERYGHKNNHKSWEVIKTLDYGMLPDRDMTPFAQAMPDDYKRADPVQAYRDYYRGEKSDIATWRNNTPDWWYTQ